MRPGKLKQRITIERPTTSTDAYGGTAVSLSSLGTFWAEVVRLGGSRALQYQELGFSRPYRITLRQNIDLLEDDKITYDSKTLVIASVETDIDRGRYQVVIANERYNG